MTLASWFYAPMFWGLHYHVRLSWAHFRCTDQGFKLDFRQRGKWAMREHNNMVRGLVPKDRLLEWQVQDGWEPLCEFLCKDVPQEGFPHKNAAADDWKKRQAVFMGAWVRNAMINFGISLALVVGISTVLYKWFF
ncbi:hypothetical protein F5B20DRAFT_583747 [Whalleya microplaca]|nr:hypothetical protein F5B20DRAFT_583747 [Whalleya microplaca]